MACSQWEQTLTTSRRSFQTDTLDEKLENPTKSRNSASKQQKLLLKEIMENAGFTNYEEEMVAFLESYGKSELAARDRKYRFLWWYPFD